MIRIVIAITLVLCGCSVNQFERNYMGILEQHGHMVKGMEFSDSGHELILWTADYAFVYSVRDNQKFPINSFLLERISLKEKTESKYKSQIAAINSKIARERKLANSFLFGTSVSLYGNYNITTDNESAEKVRDNRYLNFIIKNKSETVYTVKEYDITKKNKGVTSYYNYSYLSPNGKYAYLVFSSEERLGLQTITHLPDFSFLRKGSYHVIIDICTRKIINVRRLPLPASVLIREDDNNTRYYHETPRIMVAINEKLKVIAFLDVKKRLLEINPLDEITQQ